MAKSDMTACQEAYDELIRYRGKFNIGLDVSIDRVLGLLAGTVGRHDDATKHFEEALAICRDGGYRPELAWTCSDYAEMLFKRNSPGDRENATELQDEAIAIATELGMKPLLERVLAQREILKA